MLRRVMMLLLWYGVSMSVASADSFPDFSHAVAPAMASLRAAMNYARTGNIALAQIESGDALIVWKRLQQFEDSPPPPYPVAAFRAFLDAGREQLLAADRALDRGDAESAIKGFHGVRGALRELRRQSGLYDLGDCIQELAPAMTMLRDAATRFGERLPRRADETVATASVFRDRLQRCSEWANVDTSKQPEFRRLIDGAVASSREIAQAALASDAPLVHRYLIELQSFAQLLDFRFG